MPERAFPVVYARDVERSARFYQRLGFQTHFRLPPQGDAGYVGLRRGSYELAVTTIDSPEQLIGVQVGSGPRFEMFVYVDNVDETLAALRDGDVRGHCCIERSPGATASTSPLKDDRSWRGRVVRPLLGVLP
jgi:lactoylglutathione lyase